jgi:hypothetical protein
LLEDQTIHNQYKWSLGTYNSPLSTDFITMEADGVSLYESQFGGLSQGMIPADGSNITLISDKRAGDTFTFNPVLNSFKYLISNNLYTASELLPLLNTITPITGTYQAVINAANLAGFDYLYLVWDYRSLSSITLCYDETNPYVLCCDCPISDSYFIDSNSFDTATSVWTDENQTTVADDGFYMIDDIYRQLLSGVLLDPLPCPGCEPQTQCFEGLWEEGDPEHPDGGSITYVNNEGLTITQDNIFLNDIVVIYYLEILSFIGIVEVICDTQPALRSSVGLLEPDTVCEQSLTENDIYIIVNAGGSVIQNGDIVCNSTNPNDRFIGGNLYYNLQISFSTPGDPSYGCLVDDDGIISLYDTCVIP